MVHGSKGCALGLGLDLGLSLGLLSAAMCVVTFAWSASASGPALAWRTVDGLGPVESILDVALDGAGGFALADARGVIVGRDRPAAVAGALRRITRVGAATRVRFDGAGGVFAVGAQGLLHVDHLGRASDRTPPLGQAGRALVALDVRQGWLAVGGPGGLHVARLEAEASDAPGSSPVRDWRRVRGGLAEGVVSDVAIGAPDASGRVPLWVVAAGELHLAWLDARESGAPGTAAAGIRRQRPPGRPIGEPIRRVRVGADGRGVLALYSRATARLVGAPLAAAPLPGEVGGARWEVAFPVLPPGAELLDASLEAERVWLATTSGVLVAERAGAPYERVGSPAGARPAFAIATAAGIVSAAGIATTAGAGPSGPVAIGCAERIPVVLVASGRDLLRGTAPLPAARVRGSVDRMPRDPALAEVHGRALDHQGLDTRRVERMWRGVERRGWLPSVSLHGGVDYGSGRARDYDESFSYGQLNRLNDHNTARSTDYDAGIALSWDFADLAFSSESVDLSREARQVIGLRDNVLDEINQLYFDRRRTLHALSAFADWSDPEAASLRLRALELAAGLDAWTGGWFSTRVELPAAARAAWLEAPAPRPRPTIPIVHPANPVPNPAGRKNS